MYATEKQNRGSDCSLIVVSLTTENNRIIHNYKEGSTVDFQLVVQKSRREFTHAQNFLFKIPAQVRACADSRHDFWTTNWKSTVAFSDFTFLLQTFCNHL